MAIHDLRELFVHRLAQQYYVERELVETLDELARRTTNDRMSQRFAEHRDETRTQIQRLEDVFAALDRPAEARDASVLDGLEEDRRELEAEIEDDDLLNMVYLNAGMATERIEMTAYEGLVTIADQLALDPEIEALLEANYEEEQSAFRGLEALAAATELKSLWDRLTPS
ncbi:DUF892 family protein [Natrinema sp. 1APR25-10V2]|uniref:YciE/YciF ferroxidase family protein n=1 Tax=Natrinema sp. 1APR25-10V2 TaxID=2951081 RepID=UPI002876D4D9|nr:DUF892 family protein [Natrinema sp. 1APR25-10V2]MDS0477873.1 ferritin-like domain-containing protein [Natrinema sp. 1APR25-10V2]